MTEHNETLQDFDLKHVWHPYTSLVNPLTTYHVVSAEGCKLMLDDGRELVDGMSSWWACCLGYGNKNIINAITNQLNSLSHVMFAGIRHDPATKLCQELVSIAPKGLDYVFLADSGSVAVEVALKMAVQYQSSKKPTRRKFLTVRGGYHGDTLGAMSVTDPDGGISTAYSGYTPEQFFISRPSVKFGENWDDSAIQELKEALESHENEIAGFILEPIQQGAGGMYFYHPQYLVEAQKLCKQYDILLICDEIATGFGRTGELFACNHAGIVPDIMTIGKGLTAGMMTLSGVLTNEKVKLGIQDSPTRIMMHGPTFMANPLACACAYASIKELLSIDWRSKVKHIESKLKLELSRLPQCDYIKEVRALGACGVVEMTHNVNTRAMQSVLVNAGVWMRPFGNIIYIYPPFIISDDELDKLISATAKLIAEINKKPEEYLLFTGATCYEAG